MQSPARRIDRALVLTSLAIALLFLIPKLFQHAAAHTGDMDTGNYSNLAWAIGHGEGFTGSVTGRHHLGEHFSPIMIFVAPIYLMWSSAYVLMILQALAAAATIALVLHFADQQMRGAQVVHRARFFGSALLLVLFIFYPPFLAAWRTQFQPIVLGMPLLVVAIMLMHARRDRWLAVVTLLILMTRESAPLCVAGLGIYAMLGLRRWKLGIVLVLVAGAWAGVTMGVIMPHFRGGHRWAHTRWVDPAAMWDRKAIYLATMLLSFGPLPYLNRQARAATAAALPGILLNLLVARQTQLTFVGHYDAQTAPFLMLAAAHGVAALVGATLVSLSSSRWWWRATLVSPLLCITFFAIVNAKTPFQLLRDWWPTPTRLALVAESRAVAQKYSDAPALSAWANLGPQVCHRANYIGMRSGTSNSTFEEWSNSRLVPGAILLVPTDSYRDAQAALARKLIRTSERAGLVHQGTLVEAWRVKGKSEIRISKPQGSTKSKTKK